MSQLPFVSISHHELTNTRNMRVGVTNYGAIITHIFTPDRKGDLADIALGHDTLVGYINTPSKPYFGALIGRVGNRIANGCFELDGQVFRVAKNNGENHLHGGLQGFDKVIWEIVEVSDSKISMIYTSPDGHEGYPGNLVLKVSYELTEANELIISYEGETDKATPVALTNHTYFNLAGAGNGNILGHEVEINASRFTPVNSGLIPTGELRPVVETPFDFTQAKPVGRDIHADDEQVKLAGGFDHNFVLNEGEGDNINYCARVYEPASGRVMEVFTTEPGVQFYTGNSLNGLAVGKGGKAYKKHEAFCLETQHFPDSVNQPQFPTTILQPGEHYFSRTIYLFSVE